MASLLRYFFYREIDGLLNLNHSCTEDLSILNYGSLNLKSEGVSGDVLGQGEIPFGGITIPVVIKLQSQPCPYRVMFFPDGRAKTFYRQRFSETRFEIGNGLALTKLILLNEKHLTPHLTFIFDYKICPLAYCTEGQSKCDPLMITPTKNCLVPMQCNNFLKFPQCAFRTGYDNGGLSDTIRYLVAEKANGDLEQWIKFVRGSLSVEELDLALSGILVMIAYTLYLLDDYFDGFVHGDLGPRNILYVQGRVSPKYLQYRIGERFYNIPQNYGVIPKLWDFDKSYINNLPSSFFSYLTPDEITRPSRPFNEDLSILLSKIVEDLPTESRLQTIIKKIILAGQTVSNREMAMVFLTDPFITGNFSLEKPADQIDMVFSYS